MGREPSVHELIEGWLASARALPGRATRLARDKTILVTVVYGNVVVRALHDVRWADIDRDRGSIRWTYYGHVRVAGNQRLVRRALTRWRGELAEALRRPLRADDAVFPALEPDIRDTPTPLPPLKLNSLYQIVYDRLAEAAVDLHRISVPGVRDAIGRTTPRATPPYLRADPSSVSLVVPTSRGRRLRGHRQASRRRQTRDGLVAPERSLPDLPEDLSNLLVEAGPGLG